jgi:hypothetical protein
MVFFDFNGPSSSPSQSQAHDIKRIKPAQLTNFYFAYKVSLFINYFYTF